jgi:hypothetical protein
MSVVIPIVDGILIPWIGLHYHQISLSNRLVCLSCLSHLFTFRSTDPHHLFVRGCPQLLGHWALQYSAVASNAADNNGDERPHLFRGGGRLLFHEKQRTVTRILPRLIPILIKRGFVFVPLTHVIDPIARKRLDMFPASCYMIIFNCYYYGHL